MYTGYERFPRPAPRVQPLITFGKPKSKFQDPLTDAKSDMLHAQYRLSLLQWNAGAARRQPTQLITVMCGAFHAVLLQEAADHIPHITKQFHTYTNGDNLAILLNRDTFLPGAAQFPISEETTSKTTWGLKALVVCGYLRRHPIGGPKSVTLCTVHVHNVVAKKREAATSLLQLLYAHMKLLEVDFVGGDFNSAAKGIIADIFSDPEFMAPGYHSGGPEVSWVTTRIARDSCVCHDDRSTGTSTSTGLTHSLTSNWDLMNVMKARITQSSCTSGRHIFPAARAPPYAVTLPELDEL